MKGEYIIFYQKYIHSTVFEYGESKECKQIFFIFSYKEVSENHVKGTFSVIILQNTPISIENPIHLSFSKFGEYKDHTPFSHFLPRKRYNSHQISFLHNKIALENDNF